MFPSAQMSNITVTYRDGRVAQLEQVYIRGSKIRFLILPDMLKNAPMLKSMKNKNQGSGAGRGKAAILKAQGKWRCFKQLNKYDFILTNQHCQWEDLMPIFVKYFLKRLFFFFFSFAVAARGRGRGGIGRGNIFQKRR